MFENSFNMNTNYILEKSLDVESLRKKIISNNIANVDVPHFKRSEVNFESELRRVINDNETKKDNRYPGVTTDSRHIPFYIERDMESVQPRVNLDYTSTYRNDGNNVDIEREVVDASKNQMRYSALVQGLAENYKIIKMMMRSV